MCVTCDCVQTQRLEKFGGGKARSATAVAGPPSLPLIAFVWAGSTGRRRGACRGRGGVAGILPERGGPRGASSHLGRRRRLGLGSAEIWRMEPAGGGGGLIRVARLLVCTRLAVGGYSIAGCHMWPTTGGCYTDGCCTCPVADGPRWCDSVLALVCAFRDHVPVGNIGWWR